MPKTAADLATAAIIDVTRARTAQADDVTRVTARIQPLLEDLAARRVTPTVLNSAALPDAMFPDLVRLFGEIIAPNFGREANVEAILGLEARLTAIARYAATNPLTLMVIEQLELFGSTRQAMDAAAIDRRLQGIVDDLALRDVIYIDDVTDVQPEAALPELSRYIAASLSAPVQYDIMRMAEMRLRALRPSPDCYPPVRACYF